MADRTKGEWIDRLEEAGVPCAPIHAMDEALTHPQAEATGMILPLPELDFELMGLPVSFDGRRPGIRRPPPKLGQHNDEVIGPRGGRRVTRPATARAMFYDGARTFRAGTTAVPPAAADEVLLRVRRVGICGTDLHIFQGHLDHRVPKGGVIGHETFAEVLEAPRGSAFAAGDRVVVEPVEFCGTCRACKMGASYICYGLKVLGVDKAGGMQQYWAVRENRLIRVPASLSDEHAALMEPLAIAVHDVHRAEVQAGRRRARLRRRAHRHADRDGGAPSRRSRGGGRGEPVPRGDAAAASASRWSARTATRSASRRSGRGATAWTSPSR